MGGLRLAHGLDLEALYTRAGCLRLDELFCGGLRARDTALYNRLMAARAAPDTLGAREASALLIDLAAPLEDFLAELFGIEAALAVLEAEHDRLAPLYACKRLFVQRDATRAHGEAAAAGFDGDALRAALDAHLGAGWDELAFATRVMAWREGETGNQARLDLARRYAAWAVFSEAGKARHKDGVLFKVPHKLDPLRLVPVEIERPDGYEVMRVDLRHAPRRDGLDLTDPGADLRLGLDDANYCIWCHNQGKDSCSKGLRDKPIGDGRAGGFRRSAFGVLLAGCPLEEKISEMHTLKASGHPLGALAMICVDNPMCAATGHRVCNDCMKACVYQKQEPVNIPRSESRILKDAIELPWGVEIYGLLGRWNPLNLHRPVPKPATGKRVLIVGMGPAGFTLAHHLLNEGHTVVGVDGLKIEPLDPALSGAAPDGTRVAFRPTERFAELRERLDQRIMAGFGGLSEYGITVRWDKNYLKVIRLLLERRAAFRLYGAVRFGGTLTVESAWALGFDHVALCIGAGRPTMLEIPNGLARGVRAANDFLMALQAGGAGKRDSLTDLQLRLPVVVIGGGLTAGDTATESLAYYPVQVEKFLTRYEVLVAERGEGAVRAGWDAEDRQIADEFLAHARAIRAERAAAAQEGRPPRLRELLESWGGVTIAYRRRLIDSPGYTLNHEEIEKAMEEGVRFAECLAPRRVEVDRFGHAREVRMARTAPGADGKLQETDELVSLPARSVLVAAGTRPNTVSADEDPVHFKRDGRYFQALDEDGHPVKPERLAKPQDAHMLVHLDGEGRGISVYGDLHASFAGNVVKAMASATRAYPLVSRLLAKRPAPDVDAWTFLGRLDELLRPRVQSVTPLAPGLIELSVKAPAAAAAWRAGQFFRVQNFESTAPLVAGTRLAMEGIAALPSRVDRAQGVVSLVIETAHGSSALATLLEAGAPLAFMGPNGAPAALPESGTVLLAGAGFGTAALLPFARAAKARGLRLLLFAGYPSAARRFKQAEIEASADVVIWVVEEGPAPDTRRLQDRGFVGSIADAVRAYARGRLGSPALAPEPIAHMIAIGPDRLLGALVGPLEGLPGAVACLPAPMQCMMKEICARCLQLVRDPETGATRLIFACADPNLPLDAVDLSALDERLGQNSPSEKLTRLWIERAMGRLGGS